MNPPDPPAPPTLRQLLTLALDALGQSHAILSLLHATHVQLNDVDLRTIHQLERQAIDALRRLEDALARKEVP